MKGDMSAPSFCNENLYKNLCVRDRISNLGVVKFIVVVTVWINVWGDVAYEN